MANIHIHVDGKTKSRDDRSDGTVSDDEDRREAELKRRIEAFAREVKKEAYEIGGSFRGPGIYARMLQVMSKKI